MNGLPTLRRIHWVRCLTASVLARITDEYDRQALLRIGQRIRVSAETGCWLWLGVRNPRLVGYGQMKYHGRSRRVHQITYRLMIGPVAPGLHLDHFVCDNPPCCNPAHLRPVTPRENVLRGNSIQARNASKRYCTQGHEFTPANTMLRAEGGRRCRACHVRFTRASRMRSAS